MADVMLLPTPPLPLTTPITFLILLSAWGGSRKSAGFVLREAQFSPQVSQLCVQFSLIVILLPGGTFIIGSRKEGVKPWLWLRDREIYGIITSNNLRPAACAAALLRMGFESIEPCKTAAGAVLLKPFCGVLL